LTGSNHPFVPTCRLAERGAQMRSRMPLAAPAEPARSVLDGIERGASLVSGDIGCGLSLLVHSALGAEAASSAQGDLRGACQGWRLHHNLVFGGSKIRPWCSHAHRCEAPRRRAHSLPRHPSHGRCAGHRRLGSSWHCTAFGRINAEPVW